MSVAVDVVALEIDAGDAAAFFAAQRVMPGVAEPFEQCPGCHVRPADSQQNDSVNLVPQQLCGAFDTSDLTVITRRIKFVEKLPRQIDERGVKWLLFAGNLAAGFEQIDISKCFRACCVKLRGESLNASLGQ